MCPLQYLTDGGAHIGPLDYAQMEAFDTLELSADGSVAYVATEELGGSSSDACDIHPQDKRAMGGKRARASWRTLPVPELRARRTASGPIFGSDRRLTCDDMFWKRFLETIAALS